LTVSLLYRVGMTVMGAIQKTGTDNPFKTILEKDVDIPKDKVKMNIPSLSPFLKVGYLFILASVPISYQNMLFVQSLAELSLTKKQQ